MAYMGLTICPKWWWIPPSNECLLHAQSCHHLANVSFLFPNVPWVLSDRSPTKIVLFLKGVYQIREVGLKQIDSGMSGLGLQMASAASSLSLELQMASAASSLSVSLWPKTRSSQVLVDSLTTPQKSWNLWCLGPSGPRHWWVLRKETNEQKIVKRNFSCIRTPWVTWCFSPGNVKTLLSAWQGRAEKDWDRSPGDSFPASPLSSKERVNLLPGSATSPVCAPSPPPRLFFMSQ